MQVGATLEVTTARAWRAWLRRHHRTAREVWLVFHRKSTGKSSIAYNDVVDEALCFGWIDSVVKPLTGGARAQRFTPRRKGSPLSEMNKARVRRLLREGRMTKAGLAAIPPGDFAKPKRLVLARDVRAALRKDPAAWRNYQGFPEAYRRIRIGWVEGARGRPAEFRKRLAYFVTMTRQGKRYGMVQA